MWLKKTSMNPKKEKFIGTWLLKEYTMVKEDGSHYSYPYGEDVTGTIIYTKEGRMTALLMDPHRPKFNIPNKFKGTQEELKAAIRRYTSYSGKFSVLEKEVVHHVDMSLFPNWVGTDLVRRFEFLKEDSQLLLSTDLFADRNGVMIQHRLLWERMK